MSQGVTLRNVSQFRSGNGAAWLDLLSTQSGRYRESQVDAIGDPQSLRAWLRANDLEPAGAVRAEDVALVAATREALHRITVAAAAGRPPAPADLRVLEHALAADRGIRVHADGGGLRLRRPTSAAEALAWLVRAAVQDLTGPARAHLHACGDATCSSFFLDPTGRRRWCTDQSCGNRLRVRAHRARTAT
jgi:predicted RNA-binding Zn ribbon-like protein